ncbi:MAG TPA: AarF/ABC1/UbiB kinase family protein [Acidimicrobiales bacterium]|nr:AarF/ABC1/UbiB kinase family protein [Acidimicrobiales bacterium]
MKQRAAFVIGVAAAGWVVGRKVLGRALDRSDGGFSVRTGLARRRQLATLGGRTGGALAVHKARRTFAGAERREHLDMEFEMRTAAQIAETLGHMKGAMMKLGQMASYLDSGMPPHVREALAQLQSDAPPMSGELAAGVVESELGQHPDHLFAEWDPVPIASASIGQVHQAVTRDGRAVAVKVQYPGVDEAIESDLSSAQLLFGGLGMVFPGLESGPIVEEIRARIIEELDYRREAENQQLFVERFAGHPTIHVPAVVPELSSRRVLTTELADGVRFEEVLGWSEEERNLAAETIFRFVFRSLYRFGIFNGDPHPGNYLFRPSGQVVFLDFGLVKRFTPEEVDTFSSLVRSMVLHRDVASFRQTIEDIGLLKPGEPFSDELVEDYFSHFYEMVLDDHERTVTKEYASESVRRIFDATGPYGEIMKVANVPPAFVIIQRINLGLTALLGELGATANWRRIAEELWPFTDGPPSTPMGEREQAWLARRSSSPRPS